MTLAYHLVTKVTKTTGSETYTLHNMYFQFINTRFWQCHMNTVQQLRHMITGLQSTIQSKSEKTVLALQNSTYQFHFYTIFLNTCFIPTNI